MHIDESKKFDKRNIERNIKDGTISLKDYEIYLSKLTDASDKLFNPEEWLFRESKEVGSKRDEELHSKKRGEKKKVKGKGK